MTADGPLGAAHLGDGRTRFLVWAPRADEVEVLLGGDPPRAVAMATVGHGYHAATAGDCPPGTRYRYRLHRSHPAPEVVERPDPASRRQPQGVHGPSEVVDLAFDWTDQGWAGHPLDAYVIYEVHVGAFTPQGTFDAIIPRLGALADLGVTALELMPVGQFPGDRNWGYDGAFWYAVQHGYGGPEGLGRLVDACHAHGLAVVLDVVYNHFGPEGAPWDDFGPYRTDRYTTPWGPAINVDGAGSDEVRRFIVDNAVQWVRDFHVDALRLDAVHAIVDTGPRHVLAEIAAAAHAVGEAGGRRVVVTAEALRNDPRLVRPPEVGGYGLDAMWSDDFHHALHALLTGERAGYYQDFGQPDQLAAALRQGVVYTGQHSPHLGRREGVPMPDVALSRFVVCGQNHDQVGNRATGERLTALVDFAALKLAAAAVLLSPCTPLLFMGEEWAEPAPFLYFTSHRDPDLAEAVRRGRRAEFAGFDWQGEVPDPQDPATLERSRVDWGLREQGRHRTLRDLYRELLRLRREVGALGQPTEVTSRVDGTVLRLRCRDERGEVLALFNLGAAPAEEVTLPVEAAGWPVLLDTSSSRWDGADASKVADGAATLAPLAVVVLGLQER